MAAWVIREVSDRGTTDPLVARTILQAKELVPFFLPEERQKAVLAISHSVVRRLVACDNIASRMKSDVESALEKIAETGLPTQSRGRVIEIPHVRELEDRAEQFLYGAKLCLRDTADLFLPLFGQHFKQSYHDFGEWVLKTYGKANPLTTLLEDDRLWMRQLRTMRDAVEHPYHKRGKLHLRNFDLDQSGQPSVLSVPTWWIGNDRPSPIAHDMTVYTHNLLTFFEELLVLSLLQLNKTPMVTIAEIPEADRNPMEPIRFRLVLAGPGPGA